MRNLRIVRRGAALSMVFAASTLALDGTVRLGAQAPQTAPAAKPATEALPAARTIIDRHIEASGGRAAILAQTSSYVKGTVAMPANGMSGTIEVWAAKPDLMRTKITFSGIGEIEEGYDGKVAWTVSPVTGPALATGKELEQKKFDADFYGELRDPAKYQSITTVEKTTFAGRPCYKVSLVKKAGGEDFEFFDVATGLKAGTMISRESPMGAMNVTQTYEDYKKFGAVMQPTTIKISTMGTEQVVTVSTVEHGKVDPAIFEPPAAIKALIK